MANALLCTLAKTRQDKVTHAHLVPGKRRHWKVRTHAVIALALPRPVYPDLPAP